VVTGIVLALALVSAPGAARCPEIDHDALTALMPAQAVTPVVFFATWCAPCREHLLRDLPADAWVLGVFDERERVEQALTQLKIDRPCYMATDTAARLRLRHLPAAYRVTSGTWEPVSRASTR
jgi:hypothetical protein